MCKIAYVDRSSLGVIYILVFEISEISFHPGVKTFFRSLSMIMYFFLYKAQVELCEHFLNALMFDVFAFVAQFYEARLHQLQSGQNAIRERGP